MLSLTGRLLLATPRLVDPNFARAVIFMLNHDDDGALGVVINRPTGRPLADVLPSWSGVVTVPQLLFTGGPVAQDSALAVGVSAADGPVTGFRRVTGDYGLVDLEAAPDELAGLLVGFRVFSGYAGWSPGQLEAELREGSWYVVEALPTDVLHPDPEHLWRSVLRRQPGELRYVSLYPDDPTLN
ncbi:MAG TPA: YqgE/AlgH family protein [Nocardioidaceae bacterium]|nr:YqgE/AlgH family protein [Nocardioidaceae bacterium]